MDERAWHSAMATASAASSGLGTAASPRIRLVDTDAGGNVVVEEKLFNGHHIRVKLAHQGLEIVRDLQKPGGQPHPGGGVDGAAPDQTLPGAGVLHKAEAHDGISRVDP